MNHKKKVIIFIFPLILLIILFFLRVWWPHTYKIMLKEDSVVEYSQAVFYFLSFIVSCFISFKFFHKKMIAHGILYGVLTIGLLFVSLEEISWGQRILNVEVNDYFQQNNWQHEMSFHNLDAIHPSTLHLFYVLVGAYGAFAWLFVRLFLSRATEKYDDILKCVVPEWFISSYFFVNFFIYTFFSIMIFMNRKLVFLKCRDQEVAELLLSLGFLFLVVINYMKCRNFPDQKPPETEI